MKKIPTLFVRDFERDNGRYVTEQVTPGCEWVLAGEGVATRKYDGTCVKVENGGVYALWARREVKPGKTAPPGFVPVDHDETTGKTIGWEPAGQSSFAKFIEEARKAWADDHPLPDPFRSDLPSGTYELVGPKVNGNPERRERHELIPHAHAERLYLQVALTFATIREDVLALAADDGCEGIVWHHPDGRMAKIKARDFRGRHAHGLDPFQSYPQAVWWALATHAHLQPRSLTAFAVSSSFGAFAVLPDLSRPLHRRLERPLADSPVRPQPPNGGTMRFDWDDDERLEMPRANYMACAYNAAVNSNSERGVKKMRHLVEAINSYERVEGTVKLDFLVSKGVIDGYTDCPAECEMRPGGLFHASDCENDFNHPVSKARRAKAQELLPQRQTYASMVNLVGRR